jgi:hypothetical protein
MGAMADAAVIHSSWDNDAEQWVAIINLGGPGGTCSYEGESVRVEFDKLRPGYITRLFVDPDIEGTDASVVRALFGDAPPAPDTSDTWSPTIDTSAARKLWALMKLQADRGPAEFQAASELTTGFVHSVESAVAAYRARHILPSSYLESFYEPAIVAEAIERIQVSLSSHTWPPFLLRVLGVLGAEIRSSGLVDENLIGSAITWWGKDEDGLEPLHIDYGAVNPETIHITTTQMGVSVERSDDDPWPLLVSGRFNGDVVVCGLVPAKPSQMHFPSSLRCPPDKLTVSVPRTLASITGAMGAAEQAMEREARCDPHAANTWAEVAERWIAGRSRRRAALAYGRAAMCAPTPPDRIRFRALSESMEVADSDDYCGLGCLWQAWWSAPMRTDTETERWKPITSSTLLFDSIGSMT